MADFISIGTTKESGKGMALITGGLRRTYNTKKKRKKKKKSSGIKFRNGNSKYKAGK